MKTKLDQNDPHHRLLIGTLAMFIDDFGYTTRELFRLLDSSKSQLWHSFVQMENEKKDEHIFTNGELEGED